jgi:hypothetical protein
MNIHLGRFGIKDKIKAVFCDERLAKERKQDFERDLTRCTEFDPAEHESRNPAVHLKDPVARGLFPLL